MNEWTARRIHAILMNGVSREKEKKVGAKIVKKKV